MLKQISTCAILLILSGAVPRATAAVASFGNTAQNITMTGLGTNASGQAQVRITWGTCVFGGTNSVCTITAPLTGALAGGNFTTVLTYAGTGASALTAVVNSSNLVGPAFLANGSIVTTIRLSNGDTLTFGGLPSIFYDGTAQCANATPCGPYAVGLVAGATVTGPVTGSFDMTPSITPQGVISAGAFGAFPSITPGTWIEIYGFHLATNLPAQQWAGSDFNGINAPTRLGGTTVTIAGQAAFIDFVSPTQVNVQVPSGVPTGQQQLVLTTAGGSSAAYNVQVNALQPGLLAPPSFIVNGRQYVVALFSDQAYVLPPGLTTAVATRRARPGDTILLYGIGFGPVTPNSPAGQIVQQSNQLQSQFQVSFGGVPAQVRYFGLTPTFVGLYQFNVVVPNIAASDAIPVTFSVGTTGGTQTMITAIGN